MSDRPNVDELPEAPQRTKPQSDFSKIADKFFAALDKFRQQLADLADWMVGRVDDADSAASTAESARDTAKEHRDDAEKYRDTAADWAAKLDTEVDGDHSAKEWAIGDAVASSRLWATEDEDVEIESGKYSAYHHRTKAEAAEESAKAVSDSFLSEVEDSGKLPSTEGNEGKQLTVHPDGDKVRWEDRATVMAIVLGG